MYNYDNETTEEYDIEKQYGDDQDEFLEEDEDSNDDDWFDEDYEGELSIDVYQTENNIVIKSTIAGVRPEDIDITVSNDMITIRGKRHHEDEVDEDDYFFQECYWGGFSRSIILPQAVKNDEVKASLENGILTVILPKAPNTEKIKVEVKGASDDNEEIPLRFC